MTIGPRIAFVPDSIRIGRAVFVRWKTSSAVSKGSRVNENSTCPSPCLSRVCWKGIA